MLKEYCSELEPFSLRFQSLSVFTYPKPSISLAPLITRELLELHKDMHEKFSFCDSTGYKYYLPDSWVPHCALDISTDINVVCKSTDYVMKNFKPFDVIINKIGWVEISKPVNRLAYFELSK